MMGDSVYAWLRTTGDYSEAAYLANAALIDAVLPTNGGLLQADGTWEASAESTGSDFALALPGLAVGNGQLYMPSAGSTWPNIGTVLTDPALQSAAADNLIVVAQGRFDSPWDGIYLDLEGIPLVMQDELSDFLRLLEVAIHGAGLLMGVSVRGRTGDTGPDYSGAYAYDFSVVAEVADFADLRVFGYYNPLPRPVGPYQYVVDCITYAFSKGMTRDQLYLDLGNFSRYWPDSGDLETFSSLTYAQAITALTDVAAFPVWVEEDVNGRVREKYGSTGPGHIWLEDGDTYRHRLHLIDEYDLSGMLSWLSGMGDADHWQAIADWRQGVVPWHGYIAVENLNLAGGEFTSLLAIVQGQGRLDNPQPSNITHSRVVSGTETIVEAVFRYGEMAQDQCIQWVAAVLVEDPADVTLAVAGNVWTVTHDGMDYTTFTLFGGIGSSWDVSGAACRAYIG